MDHSKNISDLLSSAESLGSAVSNLLDECPDLTIDDLLAAERAEVIELGWGPSPSHRDCSYLVSMAALLRPIGREHGNLPLPQAFGHFAKSGHHLAGEIADAVAGGGEDGLSQKAPKT